MPAPSSTVAEMPKITLSKFPNFKEGRLQVLAAGNSQVASTKNYPNAQSTLESVFGPCIVANVAKSAYNTGAYIDALQPTLNELKEAEFYPDVIYLDISANDSVLPGSPSKQELSVESCIANHEKILGIYSNMMSGSGKTAKLLVANGLPYDFRQDTSPPGKIQSKAHSNAHTATYSRAVFDWASEKSNQSIPGIKVVPINLWDSIMKATNEGTSLEGFTSDGLHMTGPAWRVLENEIRSACGIPQSTHRDTSTSAGSQVISLGHKIPTFDFWKECQSMGDETESRERYLSYYGDPQACQLTPFERAQKAASAILWFSTASSTDNDPPKFLEQY